MAAPFTLHHILSFFFLPFPLNITDFNEINLTSQIKESYFSLLSSICSGDDGEYGTTAESDIASLQAVARRIHFGSFYVAEAKFRGNPEQYSQANLLRGQPISDYDELLVGRAGLR